MAGEKKYNIEFGTSIDTSNLEKGLTRALSKAESDVIRSAAEITAEVEKEAEELTKIIGEELDKQIAQKEEEASQSIAIIKEKMREEINEIKKNSDLNRVEKQNQIQLIREAYNTEIQEVRDALAINIAAEKTNAKERENIVKQTLSIITEITKNEAKKQLQAIETGSKNSGQAIKDFAKEAILQFTGFDKVLSAIAGGPASIAKLVVGLTKKAVAALNNMAESWRQQEQAEIALQNAAKNNPYLNDRNVKQLSSFANEMQKVTGLDNVLILQTQAKLAGLGRSQDQIQNIVKTAADMAASGIMSFDEAVNELNNSLDGMVNTSGKIYPELKNLSAEALASGQAIEIIGQKVSGSAEKAMQTGAGSVIAYKNALDSLKKFIGQDWEAATNGFRVAVANYINNMVEAKKRTKELVNAIEDLESGRGSTTSALVVQNEELELLKNDLYAVNEILTMNNAQIRAAYVSRGRESFEQEKKELELLIIAKEREIEMTKQREMLGEKILELTERAGKIELDIANNILTARRLMSNAQHNEANALLETIDNTVLLAEAEAARLKKADEDRKSADKYRKENQEALDAQIASILRRAEIEGKTKDDLSVQKQILDAQITASENLLVAAKDVIDGTAPEEQAQLERLKERWKLHEKLADAEKKADEERNKRLQKVQTLQQRIDDDVTRIDELVREQQYQEALSEISEKALVERLEFEAAHRKQQRLDQLNSELLMLKKAKEEELITEQEYYDYRDNLKRNHAQLEIQIEEDKAKAIEQAHLEMWQKTLSSAQEYINAASTIANSISTIWTNNLDRETDEKLRQNNEMVQSDEERAAKEKEIQIEAANERYKAELFAWTANVTMATAQASMAALNAFVEGSKTNAVYAAAMMAMAALTGAMQVAAIISARPKRPSFHTGGQVQGGSHQEVQATLLGNEVVMTNRQFQNAMKNQAELANMKSGGGVVMNVNIENNASNVVSTKQQMTADGLKIVVEQIVRDSISSGRQDNALAAQQAGLRGTSWT